MGGLQQRAALTKSRGAARQGSWAFGRPGVIQRLRPSYPPFCILGTLQGVGKLVAVTRVKLSSVKEHLLRTGPESMNGLID